MSIVPLKSSPEMVYTRPRHTPGKKTLYYSTVARVFHAHLPYRSLLTTKTSFSIQCYRIQCKATFLKSSNSKTERNAFIRFRREKWKKPFGYKQHTRRTSQHRCYRVNRCVKREKRFKSYTIFILFLNNPSASKITTNSKKTHIQTLALVVLQRHCVVNVFIRLYNARFFCIFSISCSNWTSFLKAHYTNQLIRTI